MSLTVCSSWNKPVPVRAHQHRKTAQTHLPSLSSPSCLEDDKEDVMMALYDLIGFHYALCSWPAHPTCRRGLLTRAGSGRAGLEWHKRGMESSFHPNHWVSHTERPLRLTPEWTDGGKVTLKVSHSICTLAGDDSAECALLMEKVVFPSLLTPSPSSLPQMQRCFGIFCVSLIFCATLSETVGLVIAVRWSSSAKPFRETV